MRKKRKQVKSTRQPLAVIHHFLFSCGMSTFQHIFRSHDESSDPNGSTRIRRHEQDTGTISRENNKYVNSRIFYVCLLPATVFLYVQGIPLGITRTRHFCEIRTKCSLEDRVRVCMPLKISPVADKRSCTTSTPHPTCSLSSVKDFHTDTRQVLQVLS